MEVHGDEEVMRFVPGKAWVTITDGEAWFQRMTDLQTAGAVVQFAIVAKETGKAIGVCCLFDHEEENGHAEIGYMLARACWGQGFMREALFAMIDWAFAQMPLRRLEAAVEAGNVASTALLRRLGFRRDGILRERWTAKLGPTDAEIYSLLRREWRDGYPLLPIIQCSRISAAVRTCG
jgi:RimJ/RimL family protein N-acetyltransferase